MNLGVRIFTINTVDQYIQLIKRSKVMNNGAWDKLAHLQPVQSSPVDF